MNTGRFSGFDVEIRDPSIAWMRFNTPERLNGFTQDIKRDLVEAVLQAQMDHRVRVLVIAGEGRALLRRRRHLRAGQGNCRRAS